MSENTENSLPSGLSDEALRIIGDLQAQIAELRARLEDSRRTEAALTQLAATDPLTELPNRRAWDDELARQVQHVSASGGTLVAAILDLDRFKQVNDAHGHAVGDGVLRAAADGLRRAVRRGDFAARIGGDEFGLLLVDLPTDRAEDVCERIRAAVVDAITSAGLPATTATLGYAALQTGDVPASFYAAASAALQRAK